MLNKEASAFLAEQARYINVLVGVLWKPEGKGLLSLQNVGIWEFHHSHGLSLDKIEGSYQICLVDEEGIEMILKDASGRKKVTISTTEGVIDIKPSGTSDIDEQKLIRVLQSLIESAFQFKVELLNAMATAKNT